MLFVVPRLDAQHVGTNPTENPDVGGSHVLRTKFDATTVVPFSLQYDLTQGYEIATLVSLPPANHSTAISDPSEYGNILLPQDVVESL
jgi:hypothetical protein